MLSIDNQKTEESELKTENWVEVNIYPNKDNDKWNIINTLQNFVFQNKETIISWHYLFEPEIRFRILLKTTQEKNTVFVLLEKELNNNKNIKKWQVGSHGTPNLEYIGESGWYGEKGWKIVSEALKNNSELSLRILKNNEQKPSFYAIRITHLFLNQMNFSLLQESYFHFKQFVKYLLYAILTDKYWWKLPKKIQNYFYNYEELKNV